MPREEGFKSTTGLEGQEPIRPMLMQIEEDHSKSSGFGGEASKRTGFKGKSPKRTRFGGERLKGTGFKGFGGERPKRTGFGGNRRKRTGFRGEPLKYAGFGSKGGKKSVFRLQSENQKISELLDTAFQEEQFDEILAHPDLFSLACSNHLFKHSILRACQAELESFLQQLLDRGVNLPLTPSAICKAVRIDEHCENLIRFHILCGFQGDCLEVDDLSDEDAIRALLMRQTDILVEKWECHDLNVNEFDSKGWTPLCWAAFLGNIELFERVVAAGGSLTVENPFDWQPLHACASSDTGRTICELLIAGGVDVDAKDTHGQTPLELAIIADNLPVCVALIEGGADVVESNRDGSQAIHTAIQHGRLEITRTILAQMTAESIFAPLLNHAVQFKQLDLLPHILAYEDHINFIEPRWRETVLHSAIMQEQSEMVALFLEYGAKVNSMNCKGETPLWLACSKGYLPCCRVLLDHGANLTQPDLRECYPIHIALDQLHKDVDTLEMCKVFFHHGQDFSCSDADGCQPLHIAASKRSLSETCRFLIDHGADISAQDKEGNTPLHFGAASRSLKQCSVLIDAGADVNALNDSGENPLFFGRGSISMAQLLLDAGCDLFVCNRDGHTVFDLFDDDYFFNLKHGLEQFRPEQSVSECKSRLTHLETSIPLPYGLLLRYSIQTKNSVLLSLVKHKMDRQHLLRVARTIENSFSFLQLEDVGLHITLL